MAPSASTAVPTAGTVLQMTTTATGATFCSFTNGGASAGGTVFAAFANGACTVPQNLAGETYVHLTSSAPLTGVLTDDITLAGPMVIAIS